MKKFITITMLVLMGSFIVGCKSPTNFTVEHAESAGLSASSVGTLTILSTSKASPELCESLLGLLVKMKPAIQNLSAGQTLTTAVYPTMVARIKELYPDNPSKQQVFTLLAQSVLSGIDLAVSRYPQFFTEKEYYIRIVNKVFDGTINGLNAYLDSQPKTE